jgi:2-polyprenyl-6-methoxyphenol hydroxylase-like FAD-dependent oxidoreductase
MPDAASDSYETLNTCCCIVGGGPAGMMLGLLLARAGVDVVVLEKHADFLRDFRGDTIHPSTLELMHELGFLEEFLKQPHERATELHGFVGDQEVAIADFSHLPTHCKFIAFMPQWDFLNFIAKQAAKYPTFHLRMQAEAVDLIEENESVVGIRAITSQGSLEVRADLSVGADGRSSIVRSKAGLPVQNIGAPMDVLWMKITRHATDPSQPAGRFDRGRILVMIYRGEYWQCGMVIPKGGFEEIRRQDIRQFRDDIVTIAPFLKDRVAELKDWNDIKLLTVAVDRLEKWHRPGLLCIGDAAHAMSPVGGVGINLAIQDAVATANLLWRPLREGTVCESNLQAVQNRRTFPTRVTQRMQVFIQDHVIGKVLHADKSLSMPLPLKLLKLFSTLRRLPARLMGLGVRPEHIHSPDAYDGQSR